MIRKTIEKESCPREYKKFIKHYTAEYVALFFSLKEISVVVLCVPFVLTSIFLT